MASAATAGVAVVGGGDKAVHRVWVHRACARLSLAGKPKEHDVPESGPDSFESSESLLQSWTSQSSLVDVQRVPSFESFEDDCSQSLCLSKPTMSFKDYIQERSDPVEQGKPVIPAAVLAGFTGEPARAAASPRERLAVTVRAPRVARPACGHRAQGAAENPRPLPPPGPL